MSKTPDELKAIILSEVQAVAGEVKDSLKADYLVEAEALATEAAHYAAKLAAGDPDAEQDLKHVRAQVVLLGARMLVKTEALFLAKLEAVVVACVRVLSKALIAAI